MDKTSRNLIGQENQRRATVDKQVQRDSTASLENSVYPLAVQRQWK